MMKKTKLLVSVAFVIAAAMVAVFAIPGRASEPNCEPTDLTVTYPEEIEEEIAIPDDEELPVEQDTFSISPIDDEIFERIKGISYPEDCKVPLDELRYLTVAYVNPQGETCMGEMICNKAIAEDLIDIFLNLYKARYPIESMVLIDEFQGSDEKSMLANNTSCFNYRVIAGSNKLSKHAMGLAIDINPLYNPYVKTKYGKTVVLPAEGKPYADRSKDFPQKIDTSDLCYKEFIKHGFKWGGNWNSLKDYQHFEK